ncbi:Pentatricopeptide repeat-containing protein [Musa troglodytarum]|uniref:Pentatricopeptide repeat-containing protein n=1 Tax=Musa troglodytarum TaxID=320322 RepID=A0A9E7E7L3_9LILI|nr:Pentatricopeptide repeat-containing protein [Musa troglodytarum]
MCSKKLSSLFAFAATKTSKNPKPVPPSPEFVPPKKTLDPFHFTNSSPPSSGSETPEKPAGVVSKQVLSSRISKSSLVRGEDQICSSDVSAEDSAFRISKAISSILSGDNDMSHPSSSKESADGMLLKNILDVPWFSNMSQINTTQWKKEVSRERKQKYIFKNTESRRFVELMEKCADKLGTKSTVEFFGKLGREMGMREYNALIGLCIGKARNCSNEEDSMVHIKKAYGLFASMREKGLQIEEQSYGPLLMYMIDMKLTQEFQMFSEFFKDENPESSSRIGYYEMLLWIRVGNEDKIRELFDSVGVADTLDSYKFAEGYLLAFCESDRKEELLRLLEVMDIWKVSSPKYIKSVFQSLGRLQLEALTEKIILQLKTAGFGEEDLSFYIYEYTTCVPNLAVEDVVSKFINLHQKLGIIPSIASYEKVIMHCCSCCKIHAALDIVDHICKSGLDVPFQCFHPILHACEQYGELDMVHPVYSMMQQHNLTPKGDAFESMISLFVKMKDVC